MVKLTATIEGEKFNLTDNPKHGIVKKIKNKQNQLIVIFFENHRDEVDEIVKKDKDASVDSIMQNLLVANPAEMVAYSETCEDLNIIATISLATNRLWTDDEINDMTSKDLKSTYEKCAKALGGGYTDFLENCHVISIPELQKK